MAGLSIEVDARALGLVGEALERFEAHVSDGADLLDGVGAALVASTQDRFERGVGPDDVAWLPSQRALAEGGQTLVDRGHLRDSVNHQVGRDSVRVGTNVVYAAIHHLGGRAGRGHAVTLPARPYLGLSDDDRDELGEIVADWLREGLPS